MVLRNGSIKILSTLCVVLRECAGRKSPVFIFMGLITYCFEPVNIVFYGKRHNEDVKDKLRLYIAWPEGDGKFI